MKMLQEGQANQPAGDTGGSNRSFPMPPNLSASADGDLECLLMKTVQEERNEGGNGDKTTF